MKQQQLPTSNPDAGHYEIRLAGRLGTRWSAWFDDLTISQEGDGTTLISGPVADQAALHGLLQRARDLGLPLDSVTRIDPAQPGRPAAEDKQGDGRGPSSRTSTTPNFGGEMT
jgi:hypothetical protein